MVNETSIPDGYKKTEVGVIPTDWEVKKLGKIAEINSDTLRNNTNANYTFKYVSLEDVQQGLLKNYTECVFDSAPSRARRRVQKSDVLLGTVRPNLKSHLFIKNDVKDFICSTGFAVIRSNKNEVKAEYIYYHLFGNIIERQINTLLIGSNYPAINCKEIKSLTIPLPPIAEQQAIAEVLGDMDALITALDRLIVKKRNIKQGAMRQLLTGQKRLPGFTGKWEIKSIGEIFNFLPTGNNSRSDLSEYGEIKYIHYGDIHTKWKYFLDCSKEAIPVIDKNKVMDLPLLEEGDLVMADASEDYEGLGVSVEIKNIKNEKVVAGLHTMLLRGNKEIVADGFKGHIQSIQTLRDSLIRIATGISVYGISKTNLKNINISLPPIPEQIAIAQVLSDMDAEIEALEKKRDKYNAVKNGMMHELLTGKTRLRY